MITDAPPEPGLNLLISDGLDEEFHMSLFIGVEALFCGPSLQLGDRDEPAEHGVGEVIDGIRGVIRPVHDLAFDAAEVIACFAGSQLQREGLVCEEEVEAAGLVVVKIVVLRVGQLAEERLVFADGIKHGAGGVHAALALGKERRTQQAQGLGIAFKTAVGKHQPVQGALAGVTERRMAEIMGEAGGLHEFAVDVEVRREEVALFQQ